ncbi:MAG: RDD family protein, partial [Solirubrobacteraceae bacterium]|nr:RDD family protein [Solirubrobacteraceae bacterium]
MSQTAVFTTQSPPADPALRHPLQVASLVPRLGAYLIDIVLVSIASWIVFFAVFMIAALVVVGTNGGDGFSYSTDGSTPGGLLLLSLVYAISFLPSLAYFALLPATKGGFNGRTIGKRAVGLQVVSADGTRVTPAAARRRGLAFFGPTFLGVVLGTLIDGIAGTPLIFTGILVTAAAIYAVTDLTFAPAGSDLRATLHDRAAKTVVVQVGPGFTEPTDQPSPITPRPRTGRLNLLNVIGGLYLLGIITAIVLIVAFGSSDTTSDGFSDDTASLIDDAGTGQGEGESLDEALDEAIDDAEVEVTTDDGSIDGSSSDATDDEATTDEEAEPAGTGTVEEAPGAVAATVAAANAKSAAGAQRQAKGASVIVARCVGQINDYYTCGSGLMDSTLTPDLTIEGTPTRSTATTGRTVVLRKPIASTDGELTMLVYDRDDIG